MRKPIQEALRLPLPDVGRRVTRSATMYHVPEHVHTESSSVAELARRRGALLRAPPATLAEYATLRADASHDAVQGPTDAATVSMTIANRAAASI